MSICLVPGTLPSTREIQTQSLLHGRQALPWSCQDIMMSVIDGRLLEVSNEGTLHQVP